MGIHVTFRNEAGQFTSHRFIIGAAGIFVLKMIAGVLVQKAAVTAVNYVELKLAQQKNEQKAA